MTIEGFLTKDEAVNKVQITRKEPISDESLPIKKTAYRPLKTIEMSVVLIKQHFLRCISLQEEAIRSGHICHRLAIRS